MKALVIVESPTKAKTIKNFLPTGFKVDSSNGHIRDLPATAKEIPTKYKKEKWATQLGVNPDKDFEPLYVISSKNRKSVKRLKDELKLVDELILATDEDREGEGISWHLKEVLNPKVPVKRMVFHEITKEAIQKALNDYRDINMNLVDAQETRRIIDRMAGYMISPVLWKKVSPKLSAGRVQSVAVRLLVDRETERLKFRKATYWDLKATLANTNDEKFSAELSHLNGKRLASGKDFDENTGKLKQPDKVELLLEDQARDLFNTLKEAKWSVESIEKNKQVRRPFPPFITSTLQQEANRKLGLGARETMRVAQDLYEQGYITYMRTDSTNLSNQAITAAREGVKELYGEEYLYDSVRTYGKKSKGAQEAHEAIRPAGSYFRLPQDTPLSGRHQQLYDLIWKRTIATQMADAQLLFTNVTISAENGGTKAHFKSSGKEVTFPGFFRAYVEGSDDPEAALDNQENPLPELQEDENLKCKKLDPVSHETKPPARYTEATLVKTLEGEGVGRPSTYASIISTIIDREYARKDGKTLIPTFTAFAVNDLLVKYFPDLVDIQFTSEMELKLDKIARGEGKRTEYLKEYYEGDRGLKNVLEEAEPRIDPQEARKIDLPIEGLKGIDIMIGKFGAYIQKEVAGEMVKANLPEDMNPGDVTKEKLDELIEIRKDGPDSLGKDPESGKDIFLLSGRYGPYVQIGSTDDDKKPKRASLLKGMSPENVDLDTALELLSLPRSLGNHPDTGKEVRAGVGRFGPFVVHDGTFASLKKSDSVLEIEMDRAVELLEEKAKSGGGKRGPSAIKSLGKHPKTGDEIQILSGRYGPYIKLGKKNISIPKNKEPETLELDEALELIEAKVSSK